MVGPTQIYRIRVSLERVIDLTSRPVLADLGVRDAELTDIGHAPCHAVGGAAHWLECDGLLVPSARADGTNLVIFADRADVDASFDVLDREDIAT